MFFSAELLERRDSGYGLLWLAATLGAKSSFKKLPKRSVLTADISQLCDLIVEPPEPLALRLSSNLMIGVARVYKVKQEMFFSDVTTCFNALKKAVQDITLVSVTAAQLQMGQPSLRPEVLTLVADPAAIFGVDFDNLFLTWEGGVNEEYLEDGSDDEYDPRFKKPKPKSKPKDQDVSLSAAAEHGRALHTLDEPHGHMLFRALDGSSITGSARGAPLPDPSSSMLDGGFGFDDVFALSADAAGADIGDELARELGEDWGVPASAAQHGQLGIDDAMQVDAALPNFGDDFQFDLPTGGNPQDMQEPRSSLPPSGSALLGPPSPPDQAPQGARVQRKPKRVRLLLDARTELTDEELKMSRANYVQQQEALKLGEILKRIEKENSKLIEEMIYGAPKGVEAPVLVDFWLENFKLHVNARSAKLDLDTGEEPLRKRRRVMDPASEAFVAEEGKDMPGFGMDMDQGLDFGAGFGDFREDPYDSRMRSSEEPGQARRGSRPPSAIGSHFDFDPRPAQDIISESQRSGLFPWDHAGPSSSAAGAYGADGSDVFSAFRSVSKRGGSLGSRRESFAISGGNNAPLSPVDFTFRGSHAGEDDFQFNVPDEPGFSEESQQSGVLTLEKNSFNFLEYAKMQLSAYPSKHSELDFYDVVPPATSTRRVAAAAFYHCLVLSTKDLLSVRQREPYGALKIRVK